MKVSAIIGCFFIFLMAITWCLIGELTQHLQTQGSSVYYPNTMFITYLSGCSSILLLIPWLVWRLHGTSTRQWKPEEQSLNLKKEFFYAKWAPLMMLVIFLCNYTWFLSLKHTLVSVNSVLYNCISVRTLCCFPPLFLETPPFPLPPFFFSILSVVVPPSLFNLSPSPPSLSLKVEVFVVSVPVLNEGVSVMKIFSVFISVTGVVLIVFLGPSGDTGDITSTWYGYVLLFVSLSFYCAQEVGFKVLVNEVSQLSLSAEERVLLVEDIANSISSDFPPERECSKSEDEFVPSLGINQDDDDYRVDAELAEEENSESNLAKFMYSSMFLGVVGVCNAFCVIWLVVIWNYTGWEEFVWPNTDQTQFLLLNMTLSLVLILSIFAGTAFTTPLMVSVGSLLVIPCSITLDYFLHDSAPCAMEFVGIFCIACGFLCIFLAGEKGKKYTTKKEDQGSLQNALYVLFHEKYFFEKTKSNPELEWYQDKRRLH